MEIRTDRVFKSLGGLSYYEGRMNSNNHQVVVGIDPGINFGFTIIEKDFIAVYYGKMPRDKEPGASGWNAFTFMERWLHVLSPSIIVIEGAAYSTPFGQVFLQEMRMGFYLAGKENDIHTEILAPNTIRKLAFGNGKTSAVDLWPTMNDNAADSLGCALAGLARLKEISNG